MTKEKQVIKQYQYDPYLDPRLQWAEKAEHTGTVAFKRCGRCLGHINGFYFAN